MLCQSLRCTTRSSGDTLPRLNRVWKQFSVSAEERQQRLELALSFHAAAEKVSGAVGTIALQPVDINKSYRRENAESRHLSSVQALLLCFRCYNRNVWRPIPWMKSTRQEKLCWTD